MGRHKKCVAFFAPPLSLGVRPHTYLFYQPNRNYQRRPINDRRLRYTLCYWSLLIVCGAYLVTRTYAWRWPQRALIASLTSVLFAPSYIDCGHAACIGPALINVWELSMRSSSTTYIAELWVYGISPLLVCSVVLFITFSIVFHVTRRFHEQARAKAKGGAREA